MWVQHGDLFSDEVHHRRKWGPNLDLRQGRLTCRLFFCIARHTPNLRISKSIWWSMKLPQGYSCKRAIEATISPSRSPSVVLPKKRTNV